MTLISDGKPLATIVCKVIPHYLQRFPFYGGDYWPVEDGARLEIRVSDMGDWRLNALVALHEFHEYLLTRAKGIKETDIVAFDALFEKETQEGLHSEDDEPGDDPRAPYYHQHQSASICENLLRLGFGITPAEYEKAWNRLFKSDLKAGDHG